MAGLETWQFEPTPGQLLKVDRSSNSYESLRPAISAIGGTINIYGSQNEPAALADMALGNTDGAIEGFHAFGVIPNFISVEVVSGSPTIVITDLKVDEDLGPIS